MIIGHDCNEFAPHDDQTNNPLVVPKVNHAEMGYCNYWSHTWSCGLYVCS
jgi:hypothetical protein